MPSRLPGAPLSGATPSPGTLQAIRTSYLFDGERSYGPSTVLLSGSTVEDVLPGHAQLPAHISVSDHGPGSCLLPGLIDPHTHLCLNAGAAPFVHLEQSDDATVLSEAQQAASRALRAGITTVRDLGDRSFLSLALRRLGGGTAQMPEILAAGPPLTSVGGHCHSMGGAVEGQHALRASVQERSRRGCHTVKVMASGGVLTHGSLPFRPQFTSAELRAVVAESHKHGLLTAAHAHDDRSILMAVRAGFDSVEHADFFTSDGVVPNLATIAAMAKRGTYACITLGVLPGAPPLPDFISHRLPAITALTRLMHEEGVQLLAGSDAGIGPFKPHDVLPHTLAAFVAAGIQPTHALHLATVRAATALQLTPRRGRIARGAHADLLAVAGNPTQDIGALRNVLAVYRGGLLVHLAPARQAPGPVR
ncbi:amidohydrolase family protein [Streptomyces sp. NPDC017988]|uniref:amidohydrolase family protein n=1 Tax=Streptomyces sp. NPDC017988 TaxID=3365025 RepID=UPI003797D855